ncbi:hemicentin-1-like [Tachysurus ichikawai]
MLTFKMVLPLCLIFLLIISAVLGNKWSVEYSQINLCALKGSTVIMNVTYTHPPRLTVTKRFWAINKVQGKDSYDLYNVSGYSGRVTYLTDVQNHFPLRLSDVKKSDEQMYYFRIRTNEEKERYLGKPGVTLSVTDLDLQIAPAEVTEGQSVVLTCKTTCNLSDPTFIWYKNSRNLTTNTNKNNEVRLQSVSSEDAGSYSCAVRGYEHLHSPVQTLRVRYRPKNVSVSIRPSGEIVENSSVTLTCSSDAYPPVQNYTWFKGNTSVGKEKTYSISKISFEDSGEYKCRGSNEVGHQDSNSVTLNVLYAPKNVSVSTRPSGEIVENSSVTLTCSSDANPPVQSYTWFKGKTSVRKEKTYNISKISSEESGEYKCRSSNKVGRQYSNSVTLNVLYPPKYVSVSVSPSGEIVEDSSVTLTCSSDANPPVQSYTWFKVNESSPVGSGQSYRAVQSGQYYCEAENKHGSERSAAVSVTINAATVIVIVYVAVGLGLFGLAVLLSALFWLRSKRQKKKKADKGDNQNTGSSPKDDTYQNLELSQISHPSPPDDMPTSSDYENIAIAPAEVTEGQSVVLTCKTTCNLTDPTFIWYKNSRDLTTKTNENNEVRLQSVSSEDAGSYSCAVRGYEHLHSPVQTLRVRYRPKNVSVSISLSGEIVENSSVTLTCSSDAYPPVQNYTWFKGITSVGKEKTYSISKISSEDSGEYKCRGSNEVGHQDSNSVTLNVLYAPKNVSVSISPSGEIVEGSSVTLTCSSDANPPVQSYDWFKVNESSPVGSGQSYRAVHSGQYYCEAQNKHGSERSAAVSVTINGVYAGLGVVLVVCICLTVTFLCIRKKKRTGSTTGQSLNQDNLYDNIAVTNPDNTVSDSASANQDEVLYASVVHQRAVDPRTAECSEVKSSASEEVQYASVRFKPRSKDF